MLFLPTEMGKRRMTETVSAERHERWRPLRQLEQWLQTPMLILSLLWLVLVLVELTRGSSDLLESFGTAIWVIFIAEFALRFALVPASGRSSSAIGSH